MLYVEIEEVKHTEQGKQQLPIKFPCRRKCGHAETESCHEAYVASVQQERQEKVCRHHGKKQYLTRHNMYCMYRLGMNSVRDGQHRVLRWK